MKRMRNIILLAVLVSLAGCTSRNNKIADDAFGRGVKNVDDIVYDLYTIATQQLVDMQAVKVEAAVAAGDPEAAKAIIEDTISRYDTITYLAREQFGRTLEMLRIPRRYIWEQRGWFSVLKKEFDRAKKRVDEGNANSPSLDPLPNG